MSAFCTEKLHNRQISLRTQSDMTRIALFVGGIKPLPESGRPSGIYKDPVLEPIEIGHTGFAGDQQADRKVHGGPEKAVHLYPASHYARLARQFPEIAASLTPGSLGENLSTQDLDETDVRIGDVWQLGTAKLQVCQPRNPCWKIDERFACDGMAIYIAKNLLTGWYWRVVAPGQVSPNDSLDLIEPAIDQTTLHEAMLLWQAHRPNLAALERLANTPGIASGWKEKILQRLSYLKTVT